MINPTRTPVTELAAALRRRELSAVELLDACLAAVDARNPELNAVDLARRRGGPRGRARRPTRGSPPARRRPFLGVPIPIKDLTAGRRLAASPTAPTAPPRGPARRASWSSRRCSAPASSSAAAPTRPSSAPITVAENRRYGNSRNPWDTEPLARAAPPAAPAAAVAGGMFPIAHANDGGGSIRIPAAYCGLVGLKSSRGRVPRRAQTWMGAVVEGVVTRTVADAAGGARRHLRPRPARLVQRAAAARARSPRRSAPRPGALRIGLMAEAPLGIPTDPDCVAAARDTAALLEELGHEVEEVEVPTISAELVPRLHDDGRRAASPTTTASTGRRSSRTTATATRPRPSEVSAYDYVRRRAARWSGSRRREVARWGRDFDVLLTPTSAILPPAGRRRPRGPARRPRAGPASTSSPRSPSPPSATSPACRRSRCRCTGPRTGLPVGTQLTGGPFDEAT